MAVHNYYGRRRWLTARVTCVWAGVDSAWEQEKLEARKMLENAAESPASSARFVRRVFLKKNTRGIYLRNKRDKNIDTMSRKLNLLATM